MNSKTVLVSSNHDLVWQIAEAYEASGHARNSLVFTETNTAAEVKQLLDNSVDPVGALIVDLSADEEAGLDIMRAVGAVHPGLVLAAAHPGPSADTILNAMRAGASEFLTPPFDLRHLLREASQPKLLSGSTQHRGKLIAFMPAQSGNGASTVALHAAHAAARELKDEILLAELDFHCSVLRERLKIEPEHSIADLLERTDELERLWPHVIEPWKGIDLLTSPASSRELASKSLQKLPDVLQYALSRYRLVFLDLPSPLMTSTREVLGLADEVYLICTPEVTSLHLARRRAFELIEFGLLQNSVRIVVNRVCSGQQLQTQDVAKVIGFPVYRTLDNDYLALNEAWQGADLLSTRTALGQQFEDLGTALAGAQPRHPETHRQPWKALLSVFQ